MSSYFSKRVMDPIKLLQKCKGSFVFLSPMSQGIYYKSAQSFQPGHALILFPFLTKNVRHITRPESVPYFVGKSVANNKSTIVV